MTLAADNRQPMHCWNRIVANRFAESRVAAFRLSTLVAALAVGATLEAMAGPLADAVYDQKEVVSRLLLERGAEPNELHDSGVSPLHLTAWVGNVRISRLLLEHGADVTTRSPPDYPDLGDATPLHFSIRHRHLSRAYGSGHYVGGFTEPELHIEVVKLLLEHGANPNATMIEGGESGNRTPLHRAARFYSPNTARLLLEHGANPNAQDETGETPLYHLLASCAGLNEKERLPVCLPVVDVLLGHGADPDISNEDGRTALHLATLMGSALFVGELLEAGADPDTVDAQGNTPARLSLSGTNTEVLRLLLSRDPEALNRPDRLGRTLLDHALETQNERMLRFLVEAGAG